MTENNITPPTWLKTENSIAEEIKWLKSNIKPYQDNKNILNYHDDIFYRLIAILVVSGKIKATEYNYTYTEEQIKIFDKKHGGDWHNNIINYLSSHFLKYNYKVDFNEPQLYYGHADLKIIRNQKTAYFEIDTVSIFKLWINLFIMKNIELIIISYSGKIIKFSL
ncbi:MAG: hypothetical protein AAB358_03420 [Patescibacteria group bacterium]